MKSHRLLLKFAGRYPVLITLTIVLGFSGALFNGISTALVVPVILGFLDQEISFQGLPPLLQSILRAPGELSPQHRALAMLGMMFLMICCKNVANYAAALFSNTLTQTLTSHIRQEGARLLLDVDLDFFHKNKLGDLSSRLGIEVARTASAIRMGTNVIITSVTILVFTGFLLAISWELTVVATGLLGLATLGNQIFVRKAKRVGLQLSEAARDYSVAEFEILSGIRLIKASGQEGVEYHRLKQLIDRHEKAVLRTQSNFDLVPAVNEVLGIMVVLAVIAIGRIVLTGQSVSLSTMLLTYLMVLFRLLPFVGTLNSQRTVFANDLPSTEIIAEFLRRDNKPIMRSGSRPFRGLEDCIRFENISFRYPGTKKIALQDVNLVLPKGTTLALVGTSGAGKSTLADLLPRFYDCTDGKITIDGRKLQAYDLIALRRSMGIVSQEAFLFNDTIYHNIAYGCANATREDVIQAARRANAFEFIDQLPQGFDTFIGDRGVLLSGGQRQRIVIARALLRNPEILILDEATSALDTVSERLVQQAIDELSRDRTVLVIAHRLSTIQNADQIAVFDQGRVVEVGSHKELLRREGYYAKLYSIQFGGEANHLSSSPA